METQAFESLLDAFAQVWFVFALAAALGAVRLLLWIDEQRKLSRSGIADIDRMSGTGFERRLALLFRQLGFSVTPTGRRGDYGADLVIEKNGVRTVVQAKCWSRNVGVKAVQEAHAAAAMYGCTKSMVVTNRYFSAAARKLARANGVILWDRDDLVRALLAAGADYAREIAPT